MIPFEELTEVADEVRRLCMYLQTRSPEAKRIMLVSAIGGEGTTTIASLFAIALAEASRSKVLLVDANTRSPGLHRRFAIPLEFGLRDCNFFETPVIHIRPSPWPRLSLVTAGSDNERSLHALRRSGRLDSLAAQLEREFEFVVWDAPPFNIYPDAGFLAPFVDGTVIVAECDRTKSEDLLELRQRLDRLNLPILGVVLNRGNHYFGSRRRAKKARAQNGSLMIEPGRSDPH